MPKQPPGSKARQISRIAALATIGTIILGLLGYISIYRPLEIKNEKENFLEAQASIENLYDKIVAKIGKPDEVKRENKCRYASAKFTRGSLSCSVGINLLYRDLSLRVANLLLADASSIVDKPIREYLGKDRSKFIPSDSKRAQIFYQSYLVKEPSCSLGYFYPFHYYNSDVTTTKDLQISLSCSGHSKAEHFPVKQY